MIFVVFEVKMVYFIATIDQFRPKKLIFGRKSAIYGQKLTFFGFHQSKSTVFEPKLANRY